MRYFRYILLLFCLLCVVGCANRGMGPQGGPKDTIPPVLVKEMPANGSVNYQQQTLTLTFNEYLQMNDVASQVLISPPQQRTPSVKAIGKKVLVEFDELLRDSTTYTIDFGASICDLNEKNPLRGYTFSFSTGPTIDSLQISGILINAEDLNPMSGIYVGIHDNLADSALSTMPFTRIARTDSLGHFCIRNVHPGRYHVFALNDVSKDYLYQPGEGLAFLDTIFVPVAVRDDERSVVSSDTIPQLDSIVSDSLLSVDSVHLSISSLPDTIPSLAISDSLSVDSLAQDSMPIPEVHTRYLPDDIVLRYFVEEKQRRYFERCLREEAHLLRFFFSAPQDTLPVIRGLNIPDSALILQPSAHLDTIALWVRDSEYMAVDTLSFLMTYQLTDSAYNLTSRTDTVLAIYRAPKISEKAKAMMEKNKKKPKLELKTNSSNSFDIYVPLRLTFATPIDSIFSDSMHLYELVDTLLRPIPFTFERPDSSGMNFEIWHEWKAESSYRFVLDSAAFVDIYGVASDAATQNFKIKSLDDYSTLTIKVEPFAPNMMIQVLSDKDVPIRTLRAKEEGTKFEYLKPEAYYVRVFEDQNGDSLWTTGDWSRHLQPEPMYYFSQKLTLRANWEFEETVYYLEKDILEQKPREIKKDGNGKKK